MKIIKKIWKLLFWLLHFWCKLG